MANCCPEHLPRDYDKQSVGWQTVKYGGEEKKIPNAPNIAMQKKDELIA